MAMVDQIADKPEWRRKVFNEKVLDLVYPSLIPLLCGRTRVLPTGSVGLKDCAESCNKGEVVPILKDEEVKVQRLNAVSDSLVLDKSNFGPSGFNGSYAMSNSLKMTMSKSLTTLSTYTLSITRSCIPSSGIS